jgi:hypothetical protein
MKTITFRHALEIVLFVVIAIIAKATKAQVPDTIYYQPFTFIDDATTNGTSDSQTYLMVYESKTLPNSGVNVIEPIDKLMDSAQVADYAFNIIYRNENLNWLDAARLMKREKLSRLYAPVNTIIRDMYGYGFFVMTRQKFGSGYEGKWIARVNGGDIIWFTVDRFMNATETNQDWSEKENARTGKILVYTENRCKVQSFFPEIDQRDYFNKELDSDFFVVESNGNKVILRKIRGL